MKYNFNCYLNNKNQLEVANGLVAFGVETFARAYSIKNISLLKQLAEKENFTQEDMQRYLLEFFFEKIADNVKIVCFFENYMKAMLIKDNFLVHQLNKDICNNKYKNLAKEQFKRPIKLKELIDLENFEVDLNNDFVWHEALKEQTLQISTMLNNEYLKYFNLSDELIRILKSINLYRNKIHFNYKIEYSLSVEIVRELELLKEFIENTLNIVIKTI